jgi:heme/copper-type cytochrome/quinol oxidase subunit 3
MGAINPDAEGLTAAGLATTPVAREVPSLDHRLTILQIRMIYVAMAFGVACFWFAEVYLQIVNSNSMWKPRGIHQPTLLVGLFEVGLVIAAGLVYFWGQWAGLYKHNFSILKLALLIAGLLGLAAIGFHIYELHHPGYGFIVGPNGNESLQTGYSSVFTVMEGAFTALLIPCVIVLLGLANRARKGLFESSGVAIEAFGELWGFLSAVALMDFLGLYIQPFLPSG